MKPKKNSNTKRTGVAVYAPVRRFLLRTECGAELWAGFFGINENGDQPECHQIIEVEVEADQLETDEDGSHRPYFTVECPKCKHTLEWPHVWDIVSNSESATK